MDRTLSTGQLLQILHWRYVTEQFDPDRRIPDDVWSALESALVLSPSSYGLQPWKFVVVTDAAVKQALLPVSWGRRQVTDCSHHVVFLAQQNIAEADLDRLIQRTAELRGGPVESLKAYRDFMVKDLVQGARSRVIPEWAARQVYIALGQFMVSAAALGIDTCPMEGIDTARYDEVLGLKGSGYATVVACPAGYRSGSDKYASLTKVRYPAETVIRRIG